MITQGHIEHSKKADNLGMHESVHRPLKIVFLGAGSCFFKNLFVDVLSIPGADHGEMVLIDIDETRLGLAYRLAEKIVALMGKQWKITAGTERKPHLSGTDYIINCIEVSGTQCVAYDYEIPLKYGVDQCIGDTIGPGGLFKALRTAPVFLEVLSEVEQLCPQALFLNYTNPMSILCLAGLRNSKTKLIGLCHSVQHTSHQLAQYLSVPYQDLHWQCGGINHLAWFTKLKLNGKMDLYPDLLKAAEQRGEIYEKDPIRFDMMLHFGYFITESSGHLSEYLPYYRKRKDLIETYCRSGYNGESGFYSRNWPQWRIFQDQQRQKQIDGHEQITLDRSWEYASYIIEAVETHKPFTVYATVANTGLIPNLPQNGVVEVPCMVDRNGVTPTYFGNLPAKCAAVCDWNMRMYDLAAKACVEQSLEAAYEALLLDPLTASACSPAQIKSMFSELVESQQSFLKMYR